MMFCDLISKELPWSRQWQSHSSGLFFIKDSQSSVDNSVPRQVMLTEEGERARGIKVRREKNDPRRNAAQK